MRGSHDLGKIHEAGMRGDLLAVKKARVERAILTSVTMSTLEYFAIE